MKKESDDGKPPQKQVKFQVSKAVRQERATDGTERITAKLNGKCEVYFSVDTMASKSIVTEGTLDNSA